MILHKAHIATQAPAPALRFDDFSSIVERYQSLVWAVAYSATGDGSLSEDIAQETFLAAWKQQADIRDPGKLRGYLATISRNLARKAMRGTGREVADDAAVSAASEPVDTRSPLDTVLRGEELSQVARALRHMPESSREAFVLFYAEGQSVVLVADTLELSPSAVKQRLYRAREALKESLETTLAQTIRAGRPGKAAALATMTFLVGQSTVASAAACQATIGQASAANKLATPHWLWTNSSTMPVNLLAAALVAVGTASLFAQLAPRTDQSTESPETTNLRPRLSSLAKPPSISPPLPTSTRRRSPNKQPQLKSRSELAEQGARRSQSESAADQPLVTGRILQNLADADVNADGVLSDEEIAEVSSSQEGKLFALIADSWSNEELEVTCARVGWDGNEVYEGHLTFPVDQLRNDYALDRKAGLELSVPEWIASQFAILSREGQICHKVYARLQDDLGQFVAMSGHENLQWRVDVLTSREGDRLWFVPTNNMLNELANTAYDSDTVTALCRQWGVGLTVHAQGRWYRVSTGPDEFHEGQARQPTAEALLNSDQGTFYAGNRFASKWAWNPSDKIFHLAKLDSEVSASISNARRLP